MRALSRVNTLLLELAKVQEELEKAQVDNLQSEMVVTELRNMLKVANEKVMANEPIVLHLENSLSSANVELSHRSVRAAADVVKIGLLEATISQQALMKEHHSKSSDAMESQVEQLQMLLDALPGAPARKTEAEGHPSYRDPVNIPLLTRLAIYFASRP